MATKMTRKHLIDLLGDDALILQVAKTSLLRLMATCQVDATELARNEMANRGLGANGEWIGFPAAAKLWQAPAAAAQPDAGEALIDAAMESLAHIHLGISTLEERRMDALDFHEVGVLSLKDALRAAFELGKLAR